jgi:nucleotide-binding universal stress UspA family protein
MTALVVVLAVLLVIALIALAAVYMRRTPRAPIPTLESQSGRIVFPVTSDGLSSRALDAALRIARAEHGVLVPVFLARVPLRLPLETPLPRQSNVALPMLEAIEQRAARFGVAVDARIERGRTYRHALHQTIDHERYDRLVIAASGHDQPGFDAHDVAWLIDEAPGELVIIRTDPEAEILLPLPVSNGSGRSARRPAPDARAVELARAPS